MMEGLSYPAPNVRRPHSKTSGRLLVPPAVPQAEQPFHKMFAVFAQNLGTRAR